MNIVMKLMFAFLITMDFIGTLAHAAEVEQEPVDATVICIGGIVPLFPLGGDDVNILRYFPKDLAEHEKTGGFNIKGLAISATNQYNEQTKEHEWVTEIATRVSLYCTSGRIAPFKEPVKLGRGIKLPEPLKQ